MASRKLNAAVRNRQRYLQLLRESAREVVSEATTCVREKNAFNATTTTTSSRIGCHAANLHLPENWIRNSTVRLQTSLRGIVAEEKILRNDLFLCALIHPSYVHMRSLRSVVAMPIELTLTGSSTFRLLKEVAVAHDMTGILGMEEIGNIPKRLHVEDLLLYDKSMFAVSGDDGQLASSQTTPPEEVRMAAATALCGAVVLSEGISSATTLLDQLREGKNRKDEDEETMMRT